MVEGARLPGLLDRGFALGLLVLGCGFLAMALSKPVILALGARATGLVVYQEGGVSTRGAYAVRYRFAASDGRMHEGTAHTAVKNARFARVPVAYLPAFPELNMPASSGYALVTGVGWTLAGLLSLVVSRVLATRTRGKRPTS